MNPNDPNNPQMPPAGPQPPTPAPVQPTPPTQTPQAPPPNPQFTPPPTQPYNPSGQPGMPMATPPTKKPNTLMIVAIAVAALLVVGGVLAFVMTSNKDNQTSSSDNTSSSGASDTTETEEFDNSSLLAEEETEEKLPEQEMSVKKTFKTDKGITGTISKLVRHYDTPNSDSGKEAILVHVSEVSDGKYSSSVASISTYRLVDGSGKVYNEDSLNLGRNELTAAGYPLLFNAVKSGNNLGEGWLAFQVPTGLTKLSLRYIQEETRVLNGKTIPAKNIDTVLISE